MGGIASYIILFGRIDRKRQNVRVARIFVLISMGWILLIFGCLFSSFFEVFNYSIPISIKVASTGGVLLIGSICFALHLIAFWLTKRAEKSYVRNRLFLILPTIGIILIAYITGFSIGPLLYPSAILLSLSYLFSFIT
jgi:hypothetical protein